MVAGTVQTVLYSASGKMAEIDAQVRIWAASRVCLILRPESSNITVAIAETDPPWDCKSFMIRGVYSIEPRGFALAYAKADELARVYK